MVIEVVKDMYYLIIAYDLLRPLPQFFINRLVFTVMFLSYQNQVFLHMSRVRFCSITYYFGLFYLFSVILNRSLTFESFF